MRVGFLVLLSREPVAGARIRGIAPLTTGFPFVPTEGVTDARGEWFGIAPLAIGPANYVMDAVVEYEDHSVRIRGTFDEVENLFVVNLAASEWERQRLPERIPGDGYFEVDPALLRPEEVLDVTEDPVRAISNCVTCQYLFPPGPLPSFCVVNGVETEAIPIPDPRNRTCKFYYPFFLFPNSPQRLLRDIGRRMPTPKNGAIQITPALRLALPVTPRTTE